MRCFNNALAILLSLTLTSCFSMKAFIYPNQLPDAYVNEPYQANLYLLNAGKISDALVETPNSNFAITTMELSDDTYLERQSLVITGTPKSTEPIKLMINGMVYGDMLNPASGFEKEYTIKVKER